MKILCTGISGMQKAVYLRELIPYLAAHDQKIVMFDTWDYLLKAGVDIGQAITKEKILDLHNLDALRAIAFERICSEVELLQQSEPETHIIISTHACFRWNKFLKSGFDVHYLNRLDPDMYVNIVEDACKINDYLDNDDAQWSKRLNLEEIITWRDEEMFITETFAQFQKKDFYIIPIEEIKVGLGDMLLYPHRRKIYMSFPITAIQQEQPELLDEASAIADTLREKFIVFNPLSVKDLVNVKGLSKPEVKQLNASTVNRDFKLVAQSDMVAVYYPVEKNSPGVNQEIMYAFTHGKEVYLYYPKKFGLSPFWDPELAVTKSFDNLESFKKYFQGLE